MQPARTKTATASRATAQTKKAKRDEVEINNIMKWPKSSQKKIYRDERAIAGRKNETAILYDSQGKTLLVKTGGESNVSFSQEEIQMMRGAVLTHNHPYSTTFSWADIAMLGNGHLSEIRAAVEGGTFYMRHPKMWPKEINSIEKIKQAYLKIEAEVEPLIKKRLDLGEIDVIQYNQIYQMHLLDRFATKYHFDYGYEKRNENG